MTRILEKFGLPDAYTVSTPADCNVNLVKADHVSKLANQVKYQSMVDSMIYIAMAYNRYSPKQHFIAVGAASKF